MQRFKPRRTRAQAEGEELGTLIAETKLAEADKIRQRNAFLAKRRGHKANKPKKGKEIRGNPPQWKDGFANADYNEWLKLMQFDEVE